MGGRGMGVRWGCRVLAAGTVLLACAAAAQAGVAPRVSVTKAMMRPTQAKARLHYVVKEAKPFAGRFVSVHYVRTGLDAPPLNDDNHNRIPDYVELAARAGDRAIVFYGHAGFKAPVPDRAGGSHAIDIYVKRLPAGYEGLTFPIPEQLGGAWVAISPNLDRATRAAEVGLAD